MSKLGNLCAAVKARSVIRVRKLIRTCGGEEKAEIFSYDEAGENIFHKVAKEFVSLIYIEVGRSLQMREILQERVLYFWGC